MNAVTLAARPDSETCFEADHYHWRVQEIAPPASPAYLQINLDEAYRQWQIVPDSQGQYLQAITGPMTTPDQKAPPDLIRRWLANFWQRRPDCSHVRVDENLHALCPAIFDGPTLARADFFQQPAPWYRGNNAGSHPENWVTDDNGTSHPERLALPDGALYRRHCPIIGMDFSLRRADATGDASTLTRWMNQPRVAEFWEKAEPQAHIQAYLERVLAMAHLQPVIGCYDDQPAAYFEIYWAAEDQLGGYYDAQPYDRGVHLLVGEPDFLGPNYGRSWAISLSHFMFLDDARTQRIVGEPRADNKNLLKYVTRIPGWTHAGEFDFPHKRAALLMCERSEFFANALFE